MHITDTTRTKELEANIAISSSHAINKEKPQTRSIKTRFGTIEVEPEKGISFPHGLLGLPEQLGFFLSDFPRKNMDHFKLLQSLDDDELCFLTIPTECKNIFVKQEDIHEACQILEYEPELTLVLFIVSTHRSSEEGPTQLSINAKAPILIDTAKKTAMQYVFHNSHYEIQHMIT